MVQVQTTQIPIYYRNTKRIGPNIFVARPGDYSKVNQRIWHSPEAASYIELPVRGGSATKHPPAPAACTPASHPRPSAPRSPPASRTATSSRPSPRAARRTARSEEHTSELQSLMRISYAVFCLKKKNNHPEQTRMKNYKHKTKQDLINKHNEK